MNLRWPSAMTLELAFVIDDPAGLPQIELAAAVLRLIRGRSDAECAQLIDEVRFLTFKYSSRINEPTEDDFHELGQLVRLAQQGPRGSKGVARKSNTRTKGRRSAG